MNYELRILQRKCSLLTLRTTLSLQKIYESGYTIPIIEILSRYFTNKEPGEVSRKQRFAM